MDTRVLRECVYVSLISFCLCRLASSQACNNYTWITQPKTSVTGGTLVSGGSSTPADCRALCESQAKCTGIDFNGAKECWLILFNGTIKRNTDDFVTHYQLKRQYSCTIGCSAPKSIGWVETRDAHVIGGTNTKDTTEKDCQDRCFNNATCRGYDWDVIGTSKCWLALNDNPVQQDAPDVLHYRKECYEGGLKIVTPGYFPPNSRDPTSLFSTITPPRTTVSGGGIQPAEPVAAEMVIEAQAIKPAYIVLAGLGGGCLLMVIVAISVICCYPLKGDRGGGSGKPRKTIFSKLKTGKTPKASKSNNGELHTRRPKALNEENVDMGTISARQTYDNHNTLNSHKERHSTELNNQVDHVAYGVDHNTHADRGSYHDIASDHGSVADRHSAANLRDSNPYSSSNKDRDSNPYGGSNKDRNSNQFGSTLDHNDRNSNTYDRNSNAVDHTNTYNGSTLDHKDRHSMADRDSNADRNSTLGRKDHHDYDRNDDDNTAYNTIREEAHDAYDQHKDDNYD